MLFYPILKFLSKRAWRETINVSTRGDVPTDAPADLRDTAGLYNWARDGYPVSNYLLPNDVGRGVDTPITTLGYALVLFTAITGALALNLSFDTYLLLGAALLGAVVIVSSAENMIASLVNAILSIATAGFWPLVMLMFVRGQGGRFLRNDETGVFEREQNRNASLHKQSSKYNLNFYSTEYQHGAELRAQQAAAASSDKSAFIRLGEATGEFYYHCDQLAAQAGLELGLTANDLSTHLVVFGATGTGKTAGVLRPLAKQWCESDGGGLLVLDGKGDLPREMSTLPDFQLISPDTAQLALLEGLIAEDVVDALASVGAGDQKMDFWRASGEAMLRASAVLLENAEDKTTYPWTLSALHQVINRAEFRNELIISFRDHPDVETEGQIGQAVRYWLHEFESLSPNTAGSVVGTVNSWINPILGHRELLDWSRASTGVDPSIALTGGRVGVAVPAYRYGSAGVAVTALVKQRIYRAVRRRGSGWKAQAGQTALLMLIDEAQEVLGAADADMWPVARSLGLAGAIATQSIDELIARNGKDKTLAMLNNFRSLISYKSSDATVDYACKRAGSHLRLASTINEKGFQLGHHKEQAVTYPHFIMFANKQRENALSDPLRREKLKGGLLHGWTLRGEMMQLSLDSSVYDNYTMIEHQTISTAEASTLLEKRFHAIAVLNRAGIVRRDVIETHPMFV